ncbi:uncharacterized protein BCN122_II1249 [Burkholderia cenocepacia]|nr:uncharacterized protein BCN122_II1249 [Burkholderia cenocepacia]
MPARSPANKSPETCRAARDACRATWHRFRHRAAARRAPAGNFLETR